MARRLSASPRAVARSAAKRSALQYQLRIELQHIEPLIWRRVLVPGDVTLGGAESRRMSAIGAELSSSRNAKALALLDADAVPASSWTDTEPYRGEVRRGAEMVLKAVQEK